MMLLMLCDTQMEMRETSCVVMIRVLRMEMLERRLQRRGKKPSRGDRDSEAPKHSPLV
jgi:hypothetical protein